MFEKKRKKKKIYHFASALFSKDMLRIVKGFAPWILFEMFEGKVSISIGVPGGPLEFMGLIRVGILQLHTNYVSCKSFQNTFYILRNYGTILYIIYVKSVTRITERK